MERNGPSYGAYAVILFAALFVVGDLVFLTGLIRDLMGGG